MLLRPSFPFVLAFFLFLPSLSGARSIELPDRPHWTQEEKMELYRKILHRHLNACNSSALKHVATYSEVERCARIYMALKLSFLNGVTLERYDQMPPRTRAIANKKGYAALRAWRHRQVVQLPAE